MRTVYLGTPDFAVVPLQKMIEAGCPPVAVFSQPDRPRGRGHQLQPTPVKQAAQAAGIPVYQPASINSPEALAQLQALQPELLVVVAYGQILRRALLDLPPRGIINVHASLLPAYRGAAPIHWAIINGEQQTGVTIMFIEQGLDCGDMILKEAVEIGADENTGALHDRLAELGGKLLLSALELFAQGPVTGEKQDESCTSYAPMLTKEDEHLCWAQPALQLHNRIRGMNPFPGVFAMYHGKRLKIKAACLSSLSRPAEALPGQIVAVERERITLATAEGSLSLLVVQPEGKGPMSAGDFARGYGVQLGDHLS